MVGESSIISALAPIISVFRTIANPWHLTSPPPALLFTLSNIVIIVVITVSFVITIIVMALTLYIIIIIIITIIFIIYDEK